MISANEAREITENCSVIDDILITLNNLIHDKAERGANRAVYSFKPDIEPSMVIELSNRLIDKYGYDVNTQNISANRTLITIIW